MVKLIIENFLNKIITICDFLVGSTKGNLHEITANF